MEIPRILVERRSQKSKLARNVYERIMKNLDTWVFHIWIVERVDLLLLFYWDAGEVEMLWAKLASPWNGQKFRQNSI